MVIFGPESEQYTFMNMNGCSVIDYLIISKSMLRLITNFAVLSNSKSCHFPISIALRFLPPNILKTCIRKRRLDMILLLKTHMYTVHVIVYLRT